MILNQSTNSKTILMRQRTVNIANAKRPGHLDYTSVALVRSLCGTLGSKWCNPTANLPTLFEVASRCSNRNRAQGFSFTTMLDRDCVTTSSPNRTQGFSVTTTHDRKYVTTSSPSRRLGAPNARPRKQSQEQKKFRRFGHPKKFDTHFCTGYVRCGRLFARNLLFHRTAGFKPRFWVLCE